MVIKRSPKALLLIALISLIAGYAYYRMVQVPNLGDRILLHDQVLSGEALSPYRYRILIPVLVEIIRRLLDLGLGTLGAFQGAYALYAVLGMGFTLGSLFLMSCRWLSEANALAATMIYALLFVVSMQFGDHQYQPWSLIEPGFWGLAVFMYTSHRTRSLPWIVLFASLNRETGVMVVLLITLLVWNEYRRGNRDWKESFLLIALCTAIWAGIFVGTRLLLGQAASVDMLGDVFKRNQSELPITAERVLVLYGGLVMLALMHLGRLPADLRISLLALPPYLLLIAVFGVWSEVRLLLPLLVLLIPAALWSLENPPPLVESA